MSSGGCLARGVWAVGSLPREEMFNFHLLHVITDQWSQNTPFCLLPPSSVMNRVSYTSEMTRDLVIGLVLLMHYYNL